MSSFLSSKTLRLILAPVLSLWVAGAGCMLGCEGMVAAAATHIAAPTQHLDKNSTIVASGHACSSGETPKAAHNCCKGNAQSEPDTKNTVTNVTALPSATESSRRTMNGCPLAVSRAAVVSKTRGGDTTGQPAPQQLFLLLDITQEQTAPLSAPLRLPNRGHTYLRCCVFLI